MSLPSAGKGAHCFGSLVLTSIRQLKSRTIPTRMGSRTTKTKTAMTTVLAEGRMTITTVIASKSSWSGGIINRSSPICLLLAALLAAASPCSALQSPGKVPSGSAEAARLLAKAEQIKKVQHSEFVKLLGQLHDIQNSLSASQQWHLKYLDAWQSSYAGQYARAIPLLKAVIDHSGDFDLTVRATAILIQAQSLSRNYEEAYALCNQLVADLPRIKDPETRGIALNQIIQMLNAVGQRDLALNYIRQMKAYVPVKNDRCLATMLETKALLNLRRITSDSPRIDKTIDLCLAAGQAVSANALRLDLAALLTDEGHAKKAIELLTRMEPSIRAAGYHFHIASLHYNLALAHLSLGQDSIARSFALQALADNSPDAVNFVVQGANEVLFKVEKRAGHPEAALSYYEKFVAQKQIATDDAKARALAYQMVRQEVVASQLRLQALGKENKILQLRQKVTEKDSETSRLYIALLLVVIVFIVLWMYRLKYSQMRFRKIARHDGLTGAFNRQHFLEDARKVLRRMQHVDDMACLVLLDLDYFKQVNDSYGHAAGDEVLTRTVAVCRQELRDSDLFGRLGGEEFGILMPSCSCAQGEEISNRIRTSLASARIQLDSGAQVKVSASFGLACTRISGYELPQLLGVADAALYRAKNAGRNRLVVGTEKDEPGLAQGEMQGATEYTGMVGKGLGARS
ncbi:MAG: GGDEF domain-containing protein [Rhodanobacteraceae bacterium]